MSLFIRKGFTLIELLVVVAMVGIMFSIIYIAIVGKNLPDGCDSYKDTPQSSIPGKCLKYFK